MEHKSMHYFYRVIEFHLAEIDVKKYYTILGFSPLDPFEKIKIFLSSHFKVQSLNLHPEIRGDSVQIQLLIDAKNCFENKTSYELYETECIARIEKLVNQKMKENSFTG